MTKWTKSMRVGLDIGNPSSFMGDEDDWPEMDTPETIVRKEVAKEKSMRCKVKFMCGGVLEEVIGLVQARSEATKIMNKIIDRSYWRIKISEAWRMLENDRELQCIIVKKIKRQEIQLD